MTYSSFDPSKVDVDAAASYSNTTDAVIEREEKRKAEAIEAAAKALMEKEGKPQQQPEPKKPDENLPTWRRTLEEGIADPDLIAEDKGLNMFERAQANLDVELARKEAMDPNQYGFSENIMEAKAAIAGGAAKTWSSILTFPERALDMTTGEMQREIDKTGKYTPDFDPLGLSDYDPGVKTWWGKLIEMGVHFTGLAGAVKTVPGVAAKVQTGGVLADIGVGAASDVISSTSQESNLSQEVYESKIVERVPIMGEFLQQGIGILATKDSDHPWMKTFKNTIEGLGADALIGTVLRFFKNGDAADAARRADIEDQIVKTADAKQAEYRQKEAEINKEITAEAARMQRIQKIVDDMPEGADRDVYTEQLDNIRRGIEDRKAKIEKGEFDAYNNRDMADPYQGSPNSRAKSAFDAAEQAKRMDETWPTPGAGSTDSVFTPAQSARMASENGMLESEMKRMAKDLLGDARYEDMMKEARKQKRSFQEVYGYAFKRMQETLGRDATAVDSEDFWKPFFDDPPYRTGGQQDIESWAMENVVAADLVNAALFSQLRDLGIASRELFDIADVMDTDGPMKTIADRLVIGLTNVKRSRYMWSMQGKTLQGPKAFKELKEVTEGFRADSEAAVNMFFKTARESDSDAVVRALVEAFSMSNSIRNWKDLDAYMRAKIHGGGIKGDTSVIVREIQTLMMHSILSGPKTPIRAIMGTGIASTLRPLNTVVGATMRGDFDTARAAAASLNAYKEALPEAWKLFRTNLSAYWSGDVATVQTRFSEARTKADDQWALYGHWVDTRGNDWDKAAYSFGNMVRGLNDSKFLNYSTSIMGATDDAFTLLMARARSREKALNYAFAAKKKGQVTEITPEFMRTYEDAFYKDLLDADGNINLESDLYFKSAVKEATLTTDLSGFAKSLEDAFNRFPAVKPFFLFARTGINGLNLSYKSTPMLGLLHKQSIDILRASEDNLETVAQYGIRDAADLANAKALLAGRQAVGFSIVTMAGMHYMNGGITGNGPQDRRLRKLWMDTGWQPRSIKIGNVWVGYDTFEPFNVILSSIADIGDNMQLMGDEWAKQNLISISLAVAGTATSKSFLQGLGQLVDALSGEEKGYEKMVANMMNNTVPLAGLRNELGKVISPYMREINGSMAESLRNRNKISEIGPHELPIKYDVLNGEKIREWNFMERMWNALSPINLKLEEGPGRSMLWNSNYDLRLISYSSPDGLPLDEHPQIRSWFQEELGKLNLEKTLDGLAERTDVQNSIDIMHDDIRNNRRNKDPMKSYLHNRLIRDRFETARKKAWANVVKNHPNETNVLYDARQKKRIDEYLTLERTKGRLLQNR